MVDDGWTESSAMSAQSTAREKCRPRKSRSPRRDADGDDRRRVDAVVKDQATAEALKP